MPSIRRTTQFSVGLLLVIVIRSLGEVLRLRYVHGDGLAVAQVGPFVIGALVAAAAALAVVTLHFLYFDKTGLAVTISTILGLLIYKVIALG